ncbi:MAG TPA: hypothetical protein VGR71_00755 [Nitrospira sp.]|nr:hypothetical protein [Nitrospira sp.]
MSQLYDVKLAIEKKIEQDQLDRAAIMGKICLRFGKVLAFIKPDTPDDAETVAKLKNAAKEILNLAL